MIEDLKQIANEIANSRVRLASPLMEKQSRQDIIDEAKRMESIEANLRNAIAKLQSLVG
jgi:hypothetical protein